MEHHNKVDVAFSSPPYYDLERYCNESTQSWIKYRTYVAWKEEYLKVTIQNIYKLLKDTGLFIINIKNIGSHDLANDVVEISKEIGFTLDKTLNLEFPHFKSTSHKGATLKEAISQRSEPIFIFKKQ